ncbi:uncharacterized protein BBOV_I002430 [Babesia bovis T2Bo]|uniref:Membrane protein, putative n=1 Tax=Babesia bovis TaxID=5865 RepID=A7AW97_BABBO|nr:uncharacterized protein BBOV_I002430 [Babesia bovis T2Bo]EDO05325.1 putative integral membrane protein [Babesia bovis T2Bo]|eukprot:XP_001608893.1 hypothetical protein [Babesia bovis T2Bo]
MAPPSADEVVPLVGKNIMFSHPANVIQFHIALWLLLAIAAILILFMYFFYNSFGRDDPILYSQINVTSQQKNK